MSVAADAPAQPLVLPSARTSRVFQAAWPSVLCLVALDYLSTLAYQPSLAYQAGGLLAPLGTVVVVIVTLCGALPLYLYVAGRSPHGGGAVALLERLIPGWWGKLLIVILLGFTATDFVLTRTFSAAAAAEHLVHNPDPHWQRLLDSLARSGVEYGESLDHPAGRWLAAHADKQLAVTVVLLFLATVAGLLFFRGFNRFALRLAIAVVAVFLLLNTVVIGAGLVRLAQHPGLIGAYWDQVLAGDWHGPHFVTRQADGWHIVGASFALFPKLALGLSGFELAMIAMPLVRAHRGDDPLKPAGRIADTRKLLVTAAVLASAFLLASAVVTALLIPPDAFGADGPATHRALAYLAHGGATLDGSAPCPLFGPTFGTVYDLSTVTILCLAGASVSIGLRDLVPPYLHRLGMELNWSYATGALLYLFSVVKLVVTFVFRADLDAQRNAYATSVLVLLTAAGLASVLDRWDRRAGRWSPRRVPWLFGAVTIGFAAATVVVIWGQPGGLKIASFFVVTILLTSMISRGWRSLELRCDGFDFADPESRFLWESLKALDTPMLVPHRPGHTSLADKEARIRAAHRLPSNVPVVFIESTLADASEFHHLPLMRVVQEEERFVIHVDRCASVPHVLAAVALELSRVGTLPEVHFGWSNESPLTANLHFVLFGHGNVPWMVHALLQAAEKDPAKRPRVVVG